MSQKKIIVEKRNILNEIIAKFNLQELRLFSIYLGRIDPRDPSRRIVALGIKDFYRIIDLQQQYDKKYLKEIVSGLLTKLIYMPDEKNNGNLRAFVLFKECAIVSDAKGNRYFEIEAHEKAIPLLFDYRRDYFKYELWNVLNLESANQIRMYEILKQYEWRGERIITVTELKALLGIEDKEYPNFNDFKKRVLCACKKALKEKTDIEFTYEPYLRSGRGGKIQTLRFNIAKNIEYKCQLEFDDLFYEFIDQDILSDINKESEKAIAISDLDFILEPLTHKDKLSILEAADGDAPTVRAAYEMAKQQGSIKNLTAWLIDMVKKIRKGEISQPVSINQQGQNKFVNFRQRGYDYAALEEMENKQLREDMGWVEEPEEEVFVNCFEAL